MFRMGPVHAQDNGSRVYGTEPECTARYQDLFYARIGIGYHKSHRNSPRACAYLTGLDRRGRGASIPYRIPGGYQVIPQDSGHA